MFFEFTGNDQTNSNTAEAKIQNDENSGATTVVKPTVDSGLPRISLIKTKFVKKKPSVLAAEAKVGFWFDNNKELVAACDPLGWHLLLA